MAVRRASARRIFRSANDIDSQLSDRPQLPGYRAWLSGLGRRAGITASFLATAAASMMGSSASAPTLTRSGESTLASGKQDRYPSAHFVDRLVRSKPVSSERDDALLRSEAEIIFANALRQGTLPAADRAYLAQVVAAKTGVNEEEGEKRVSETFVEAQVAADTARKTLAHLSLWLFVSLLIGAFCTSFAAIDRRKSARSDKSGVVKRASQSSNLAGGFNAFHSSIPTRRANSDHHSHRFV
jgi:hypothetical protein